jgi:hypothetical protein
MHDVVRMPSVLVLTHIVGLHVATTVVERVNTEVGNTYQ